jgi:hypothetical protein
MANILYDFARNQFLSGQLSWLAQPFGVVLINTNFYTVQPSIHRTLSDVPANARIAVSPNLTSNSASGGVARAADLVITNVTGPVIEALVIFHNTGTDSTSELIAYIDTAMNLPWTPQGLNVVVHWDTGPNGIFKL